MLVGSSNVHTIEARGDTLVVQIAICEILQLLRLNEMYLLAISLRAHNHCCSAQCAIVTYGYTPFLLAFGRGNTGLAPRPGTDASVATFYPYWYSVVLRH
jgi:hypothetical protein